MEDLLYKISIQHEVDPAVVSQILDIERKNVYKKRLVHNGNRDEALSRFSFVKHSYAVRCRDFISRSDYRYVRTKKERGR